MSKILESIGFNSWVHELVSPEKLKQFALARVVAVHRDSYVIHNGETDVFAELVGRLAFSASSPADFPAVGDWVLVNCYDGDSLAIIHEILPRKSVLRRKTPGKKIDFQMIAANIDMAFIVQSLDENFNLRRLERYLVMINDSNIEPLVLLSKSDLLSAVEISQKTEDIRTLMPRLQVVPLSNKKASGLDPIKEVLHPGQTYCLLGSSGVGKTTLLNNLIGQPAYKTKSVSEKDGKGRHTTTHRQLVRLASGALVVDTPGMRELGNFSVDKGLEETFPEITALSEQCHFSDCSHTEEKGCAVSAAMAEGLLQIDRYQSYLKMTKETAFNEMSYLEKRKKDKDFGKMCKAVMKQKKNRR